MENLPYVLVWSDEFNYEGAPDPDKWSYDVGGSGWGNNELQYYTAGDNVYVDGEKMIIQVRHETMMQREVTSTRITTKGKCDWLYGKVEVRAKLPKGLGTWPAIWMLPSGKAYGGWPACGEIDIMEHVGYDFGRIYSTVHTAAFNHVKGTQKGDDTICPHVDTEFHLYAVEWQPDKLRFFVDGNEIFTYEPAVLSAEVTFEEWPFDKPFYLLINVAFGGNWGGAKGVDYSVLPVTMEIDYVRVYQRS